MSQGVYFVTKGIAEAYVKETVTGGEVEERVKSVMGPGKIFGYTRFVKVFFRSKFLRAKLPFHHNRHGHNSAMKGSVYYRLQIS